MKNKIGNVASQVADNWNKKPKLNIVQKMKAKEIWKGIKLVANGGSRRSALNLQRAHRPQSRHDRWAHQRNPAPCAVLQADLDKPGRHPISPREPILPGGPRVSDRSRSQSCFRPSFSEKDVSVYPRFDDTLFNADQYP